MWDRNVCASSNENTKILLNYEISECGSQHEKDHSNVFQINLVRMVFNPYQVAPSPLTQNRLGPTPELKGYLWSN